MKKIARIQIDGKYEDFENHWNSLSKNNMICGAIAIRKGSHTYDKFRRLLQEYPEANYEEWIDIQYEKRDIEQAEVLQIGMDDYTLELQQQVFEDCFQIEELCEQCHFTRSRQVADLRINPRMVKYDAQYISEVYVPIVSKKFRQCVEGMGVEDIAWRTVLTLDGKILDDYFQLIINTKAKVLVPPTKVIYEGLCLGCGRYGHAGFHHDNEGHGYEHYVAKDEFSHLMLSDIVFGPFTRKKERMYIGGIPDILVTQAFYQETIRCGLRGLGFTPVTVLDE